MCDSFQIRCMWVENGIPFLTSMNRKHSKSVGIPYIDAM